MTDVNHPSSPRATRLVRAAAIALAATFAGRPEARAQDASFGCKVLLCAAATAPSWAGIPYCVPVMQQLIRQVARGGAWPVCLEGQVASSPSAPAGQAAAEQSTPTSDLVAGQN